MAIFLKQTQLLAAKANYSGAISSVEVLSLDIIRNTLSSLTQMKILLQVEGEFNAGKERLVKVLHQQRLQQVYTALGMVVSQYYGKPWQPERTSIKMHAKL